MRKARRLIAFALVSILPACASFQTSSDVQTGRRALLVNDPESALPYFLEAAQRNPDYVYRSENFSEGIWTYVGRTQYTTKRYQEALQSLERALAKNKDDFMARLYYGLALVRTGDRARGLTEIKNAMQEIHDWLEYQQRSRPFQAFWDPLREIRKAIEKDLDETPGKDLTQDTLVADAEWLGDKMENEVERVRQDEQRQFDRDSERGHGSGVGVGIGF